MIGFEESFLDKKALPGDHFKKFHESSIKISNDHQFGLQKKKKKKCLHFESLVLLKQAQLMMSHYLLVQMAYWQDICINKKRNGMNIPVGQKHEMENLFLKHYDFC